MLPYRLTRPLASGRAALAASLFAAALALTGCGGGSNSPTITKTVIPPTNTAAEELYVADAGNNNIPVIGISSSGTPFALGSPANLPSGSTTPQDVVVEPLEEFVLVASSGGRHGCRPTKSTRTVHCRPPRPPPSRCPA